MSRICIVHFNAIEKYPPAINFLRYIATHKKDEEILVITTWPDDHNKTITIPGITINRVVKGGKNAGRIKRVWQYVQYHVKGFRAIKKFKPDSILYYETLSAGIPALYKKLVNGRVNIFVHYHEYTSLQEYNTGMVLNRWLRNVELGLYAETKWVSHTNEDRMNMFLEDIKGIKPPHTYIWPNYPPADWFEKAVTVARKQDKRIGFVYVGALSLDTMYTKEMATWVAAHEESCYWDIYSNNHDKEVLQFLDSLGARNITFKGAVDYNSLPLVLPGYDVGVILYSGAIDNYIYCIPNKLYEYYVCGLHVIYPSVIKSVRLFKAANEKPWVKGIDFTSIKMPDAATCYRPASIPKIDLSPEPLYHQVLTLLGGNGK
jgi:hypothetical protein